MRLSSIYCKFRSKTSLLRIDKQNKTCIRSIRHGSVPLATVADAKDKDEF